MDRNSKTQLLEHSAAKVRLLGEYLTRYLSVITNDGFTTQIKIYDLFCGEGIYSDGGEGSPIVIMRSVKDVYFSRQAKSLTSPVIDCLFNDEDGNKVDNVQKWISDLGLHYPEVGNVSFEKKDYKVILQDVLREITPVRNKKNFIFIDPYGYKDIRPSEIRSLLNKGKVELLLFLPISFMYRFDYESGPDALRDFTSELVAPRSWEPPENAWAFVEMLTEEFRSYLGHGFFVDSFTIQKDPQTVFALFFFCDHIKGFEKMLEAKWKIDLEEGRGWNYSSDHQASMFVEIKTFPLEDMLRSHLSKNPGIGNGPVYEFTLRCGYLPTHTTEVLTALQDRGELLVSNTDGEPIKRGRFYINYGDFRDAPNKVTFRVK